MFWNKKECPKEVVDAFAGKVKCETCKHWIDEFDAQRVESCGPDSSLYINRDYILYFCPKDRVAYSSRTVIDQTHVLYYVDRMQVSEDGVPVGYVKKEKPVDVPSME